MNFYKTSLYSAGFSIVNLITGIAITKITAQLLGPVGTAYIGKFANISGLVLVVSTASISVGLIRYISESRDDPSRLQKILQTASALILAGSILGCAFIFASYRYLLQAVFNQQDFSPAFLVFGIFLLLISAQVMVNALLNGLGAIRTLALVNACAALANMAATIYCVYRFNITGALLTNSLYGILYTLTGCIALRRMGYLRWHYFKPVLDRTLAIQLLKYGTYAAITSSSWMLAMLLIREDVESRLDTASAGLWQAMFSLSDRYLGVVTNVMMIYFIPRFSGIREAAPLIREMRNAFVRILPAMFMLCLTIWLLRDWIIYIFLAKSFEPMRGLFGFQLAGDFFKIVASLMAYLIASKAMFRTGLKADLSFHIVLVLFSHAGLLMFGLPGATCAYAIACMVYCSLYLYFFRDLITQVGRSFTSNS
ncbi:MAG: Lipid III flippase [Saprospiraceae bacterium]|nr:Lipid III flippase [Saprospiraceae bacterium]